MSRKKGMTGHSRSYIEINGSYCLKKFYKKEDFRGRKSFYDVLMGKFKINEKKRGK